MGSYSSPFVFCENLNSHYKRYLTDNNHFGNDSTKELLSFQYLFNLNPEIVKGFTTRSLDLMVLYLEKLKFSKQNNDLESF